MSEAFSVESHFRGKEPVVTQIYTHLLGALRQFGSVTESPKKTSIHLDNHTGFAGVYTRKNYINLHFRTAEKIESPRIEKIEQLSARRFMHLVKLESVSDVDDELLGWLKHAYEISG